MDDDDADYMQGSEGDVRIFVLVDVKICFSLYLGLWIRLLVR